MTQETGTQATVHGVEAEPAHGLEPRQYVGLGIILTIITLVELVASDIPLFGIDPGIDLGGALVPVLIVLSAVKFAAVLAFFMHLYFDSPLFTGAFVGSLALGGAIIIALITLFATDLTAIA